MHSLWTTVIILDHIPLQLIKTAFTSHKPIGIYVVYFNHITTIIFQFTLIGRNNSIAAEYPRTITYFQRFGMIKTMCYQAVMRQLPSISMVVGDSFVRVRENAYFSTKHELLNETSQTMNISYRNLVNMLCAKINLSEIYLALFLLRLHKVFCKHAYSLKLYF